MRHVQLNQKNADEKNKIFTNSNYRMKSIFGFTLLLIFIFSCDSRNEKREFDFYKNELIEIQKASNHLYYCSKREDEIQLLNLIERNFYLLKKKEYDDFFENSRIMSKKAKISAIVFQLCYIREKWGIPISEIKPEHLKLYIDLSLPEISEDCINYYP